LLAHCFCKALVGGQHHVVWVNALRSLACHSHDFSVINITVQVLPDGAANKRGFSIFSHGRVSIAARKAPDCAPGIVNRAVLNVGE
jgi:hypothetical protein